MKTGLMSGVVLLVFLACAGRNNVMDNAKQKELLSEKLMGGPCEYRSYRGRARIISISRVTDGSVRHPAAREEYEVKFIFSPEEPIDLPWLRVEDRPYTMYLENGRLPGPEFVARYGIEVDKTFASYLEAATRGSCTPVRFRFPAINLSSHSENGS